MFRRPPRFRLLASSALALAQVAVAQVALVHVASAQVSVVRDVARMPATLAGQAVVPALTLVQPPADAPKTFGMTGRFTAADRLRRTELGTVPSVDFASDPKAPRPTGIDLPLAGQAVQGFSAIEPIGGGGYLILTDNGFGGKANSVDAMLMVHRVEPNFTTGEPHIRETMFLRDPDQKVPFAIVNEHTSERYLTGADFDPESLRIIGDEMWIGDEFGPYLIKLDRAGKVLAVFETKVGDKTYRSPDHYMLGMPGTPGEVAFEVRRSGGFEPMGKSPDGRFLYPGFEKPLWDAATKASEMKDGRAFTRILEFSVAEGRYTGRWWSYELGDNANVVADLAMVDATSGVLIERDDTTEGSKDAACKGEAKPDCFNKPAAFKRLVKIVMGESGQPVRKVGYVDLTDIADPAKKAKLGARADGRFELPHLGPEGLAIVDADHVVVVNDNNFPYSMGRTIGRPDDGEITLLSVPELLRAR